MAIVLGSGLMDFVEKFLPEPKVKVRLETRKQTEKQGEGPQRGLARRRRIGSRST